MARRLPATFAALGAGRVHPVHVRIIEDETRFLTAADAAAADVVLAGAAPGTTFGELRAAAHKLVLQLDPEAARKRKEAARGEAHVRRFREDSGNAGMVARELPSDEVLASWQHVEQRALDLRAAGMPGTLRELRVRAYLDLLQERDSRDQPADSDPAGPVPAGREGAGAPGPTDLPDPSPGPGSDFGPGPTDLPDPGPDSDLADPEPAGREAADEAGLPDQSAPDSEPPGPPGPGPGPDGPGPDGPGGPGGTRGPRGNGGPGGPGPRHGPAPGSGAATGPSVAALVTITVPWATVQGQSETPGEAAGFGVLDGDEARDLVAAAARHPRTRWCITALNPDGTAAAHGCLPGRHPPPGTGPPGSPPALTIRMTRSPAAPAITPAPRSATTPAAPWPTSSAPAAAPAPRRAAPGPAARCDLDHTRPWDEGGPTCECNLAPLCRHHHRCKQAQGWQLEQPEPGVLIWRTPSGRSYITTPTGYPL